MDVTERDSKERYQNRDSDVVSDQSEGNKIEVCITKDCKSTHLDESFFPNVHSVDAPFKKPIVVESKGKTTKISKSITENLEVKKGEKSGSKLNDQNSVPVPYIEPIWSCTLKKPYSLEILKSGVILENIDLSRKPYFVFGRQSNCDIQLAHPTVSRYHAILQHRADADTNESQITTFKDAGIYIYDMGSTHGTFVNKILIPKQKYIRLHVGHIVKFGGSTRSYVLLGPESDVEKELEKSVTQLKEEASHRKNVKISADVWTSSEEIERDEVDLGIDWGLGEDADEDSDLTENPFAVTQNEELYLNDPKKSLRGWFEREGEDLEYNVEEKSFGQFLCQVKLPLDDAHGRPLVAEALVKGKKKEAVVQCALEACRILDRMGLLRQANHESRKRKARNWEEDDFYESDEDTFLDRTGIVEKKRERRMRSAGKLEEAKAETYDTLVIRKHEEVLQKLKNLKEAINVDRRRQVKEKNAAEKEEDALDAFMSTLHKKEPLDKVDIRRQKVSFAELQQEEARLRKLINIACPTSMPEVLQPQIFSVGKYGEESTTFHTKEHDLSTVNIQEDYKSKSEENEKTGIQEYGNNVLESEEDGREEISEKSVSCYSENKLIEDEKKTGDSILLAKSVVKNYVQCEEERRQKYIPACDKVKDSYDGPSDLEIKSTAKRVKIRDAEKKDEIEPDYSLWVPPDNQTGDGKTKLNEKYGY